MVTKKTPRSPKSAAPLQSTPETTPAPKARAKAPAAKARRVAAPRKRPAAAPSVTEATAAPALVTDEEIRVRAYYLSLEHRGSHNNDVDFWLLAERELRPSRD